MTTNKQIVSTETLLDIVANPRRRTILNYLSTNGDETVRLDELTRSIAADGGHTASSHSGDSTATDIELHHTHLPKPPAAGITEYDAQRGIVTYHSTDRVEKLLEFVSTKIA
ncbi:DUF7344 domain-containing protein [Halalkalirubrum salinum]|uniref:DUF7344 domain-containing protein n=1 Tax=Halalkalirubrum salinum TaxID=2563889 RepID=UPI0010FB437D|nr:hypothetical protein [Halalkalirubrum salinum]